ncbi:MAG TPA: hypothetical protein VGI60_17500 [Chthoniobacterales bacterium]|jgi:hypothetical protein
MNERYVGWRTPQMSRDFEMLILGHGHGLPLIFFPTSFGRYHQNKGFELRGACAPFAIGSTTANDVGPIGIIGGHAAVLSLHHLMDKNRITAKTS